MGGLCERSARRKASSARSPRRWPAVNPARIWRRDPFGKGFFLPFLFQPSLTSPVVTDFFFFIFLPIVSYAESCTTCHQSLIFAATTVRVGYEQPSFSSPPWPIQPVLPNLGPRQRYAWATHTIAKPSVCPPSPQAVRILIRHSGKSE